MGESGILGRHELKEGTYALVTLHRPAIVDGPLLDQALAALAALSAELPVVFPVHPRTRKRIVDPPRAPGLTLIEPVGYLDFLALQAGAAAVITDSGGVQEETTFLGVPCFTLRDGTERPVTVTQGTNHVLGLDVARVAEVPGLLADTPRPSAPPEGWDGRAAARIAALLIPALERDDEARPCAASAAP
jgi:UDP-N-acetylglucosamine 2-epimerase (non-hydrolysing)